MASTFKRVRQIGVGTARTRIGTYTVPANTTAVVIGMSVANVLPDAAIAVTLEHHDGAAYAKIGPPGLPLAEGQAWAPDEIGKLVLQTGDSLHLTSDTAASADVFLSVMEIT